MFPNVSARTRSVYSPASPNVTFVVAYSRAIGIPRSQYRLRFTARDKNQDGQTTNVRFVDAEDTGNLGTSPVLFVTYSVPQ